MIKRFFISMLGSMAAIWLSFILLGFLFVMVVVAAAGSLGSAAATATSSFKVKNGSVLVIDLNGTVAERKTAKSMQDVLYGSVSDELYLNDITTAVYRAAHDTRIKGIYLECDGASAGVASLQAIEEALKYFKSQPDKWVMAYGDNYTQGDFYVASCADERWLNPQGAVDIHGLSGTTLFYTGLLEKLGVTVQVLRVGTFKSAVEPYILKEMSPASRMQQEVYMNSIWGSLSSDLAANLSVDVATVNKWADDMILTAPADSVAQWGLVSNVAYRHEAEQHVADLVDKDDFDDVELVSVQQYISAIDPTDFSYLPDVKAPKKKDNTIAVLYATGEITDSEGSGGIVGSEMVDQIFDLIKMQEDDGNLAGLILRVNSPGGSAFASEQIWEALEQFKSRTGLPFYVSMGDVAASGGYYISCGADKIFAQPTTITGSIGIFGLIPNVGGLLDKHLGVTTSTVKTNRNGSFPTLLSAMTDEQRDKMQGYIERGYDTFTRRCATGRHISQDSIKAIAEGRVWAGAMAQKIGLVDSMGTLRDAIFAMAADKNLTSYRVVEYPQVKSEWWESLLELDAVADAKTQVVKTSLLDAETYRLYRQFEQVKNAPLIQCRMETVVIN
jgi:protease-4